jgi:GNAT superfamily N-acetyltransferase
VEKPAATISPLDSERFGVVVARADGVTAATLPALLASSEQQRVELLIARCDGGDLAAAKAMVSAGLAALEFQIVFKGPLQPRRDPAIREGRPEDRDAVVALAQTGFDHLVGHYHADPRLDSEACREGYVEWALRGLSGDAADAFFVVDGKDGPQGFGMFKHDGGAESAYVLATVDPAARGRGLYVALLHHGMDWAAERGAEEISGIVAHGNVAPQRNLLKAGLLPVATATTFHGWRDRMAAKS